MILVPIIVSIAVIFFLFPVLARMRGPKTGLQLALDGMVDIFFASSAVIVLLATWLGYCVIALLMR